MKTISAIIVCAGIASMEPAATADLVNGPVLALTEPSPGEYRVLRGAPGSLQTGEALVLPEGTARAHSTPRHEWLMLEREGGSLAAFDWRRNRSLELGLTAADRMAFSPSGRDAAFYFQDTARIVVLTGLPENAQVLRDEKRGDLFEGARALAVSDGGESVVAQTGAGRLLRLESAASIEIHRSDDISSFVFVPGGKALLVGDRLQNAVLLLDGAQARVLLSATQGLDDPDGVWAGSGNRVAVGSYKRGQVWSFDGAIWRVENVEGLARMEEVQLRDTLLLSTQNGGAARLLTWGNPEQNIFALPRTEE